MTGSEEKNKTQRATDPRTSGSQEDGPVDQRIPGAPTKGPAPIRIHPTFRHYAWGDAHFIPELTGVNNPDGRPFAELWLGAHASSPSGALVGNCEIGLDRLLSRDGERILGPRVFRKFGGLPFLLKVLSVRRPLSIQVHPNFRQARLGFARENAAAVPVDRARRSYVDDRHKPELLVALTEFYALAGFRPFQEIERFLRQTPEIRRLAPPWRASEFGLRALCRTLMGAGPELAASRAELLKRWRGENRRRPFAERDHRFWILKADSDFSRADRPDPGLLLIPLLNLVRLKPLQGLFVGARQVHAHLKGAALEIMGNSDNVVRAGLTPKHVDGEEFLRIARFQGTRPAVLEPAPDGDGARAYPTEAREFRLRGVRLRGPAAVLADSGERAALVLALAAPPGTILAARDGRWDLKPGQAWLMPRGVAWRIEAAEATVFVASTP